MDCVIVGGGAAGMQAAFSCRQRWPQKTIALIDAEQEIGYFRTLLPKFMVRTLAEKKLFFWHPQDDPQIAVRSGLRVESIDRKNKCLNFENKEKQTYARLIIASGGRPIVPLICCHDACEGIFPVRDLTAARAVQQWLPDHPQIVILGGGLVGVKTAVHLARPGLSITLVEKEDQLLPQALSRRAAARVAAHLERKNIRVLLGCSLEDVKSQNGRIKSVQAGGEWLDCRTLLVAAGSTPEVTFLEGSDLLENGDLIVSPALQTRDKNIFAAGDAVTIVRNERFTPWTWPQAVTQGKLVGMNIFEPAPIPVNCLTRVNSMNLDGLSLVILGAPIPGAEVISYSQSEAGIYREIFHIEGQIVGGALIGDISGAGTLHAIMNTAEKIDKDDDDLLKPQGRALSRFSWRRARQHQRARFI